MDVVTYHPKSNLISLTVLAQKYFNNHDSNRIQAQEARKILKKYPDAVIADVTGHPCGIGENMGDFVPLSGYHLMMSEG